MALHGPTSFADIPPIKKSAADLARYFGQIDLTKFRFKSGGLMIFFSVAVFFCGDFLEIGKHFRPEFSEHAWLAAKGLFLAGLAFAGKEIIEAVVSAFKKAPEQ